jgi:FMN phosphatase YigB (HAD superfamily)
VRDHGLEPFLAAQVYSDEQRVRKPNPEIFRIAARQIGVDLAECWYVGDQIDRDVLGGRRAAVGRVLLLPSSSTGTGNDAIAEPDAVIECPSDVLGLLPARTEAR